MRLTKKQQEETVKVTCYGKTKAYKRKDAIAFFREGMLKILGNEYGRILKGNDHKVRCPART